MSWNLIQVAYAQFVEQCRILRGKQETLDFVGFEQDEFVKDLRARITKGVEFMSPMPIPLNDFILVCKDYVHGRMKKPLNFSNFEEYEKFYFGQVNE